MWNPAPSCRLLTPGLFLLSMLAFAACERASPTPPLAGSARHDFGVVDFTGPDLAVEHVFKLTNATGQALDIDTITATCGCVTPSADVMTIAPGGALNIATAMKMKEPGQKREHVTVVFKQGVAPMRLDLAAIARLETDLSALEPSILATSREPGALTLEVRTTIPDWPPPSPYFNEIFEITIDFEGWQAVASEDAQGALWRGVLRFTPHGFTSPDAADGEPDIQLSGRDTMHVRVGHSNEIDVPLVVRP